MNAPYKYGIVFTIILLMIVMNTWLYIGTVSNPIFQEVYLINLDRRSDRLHNFIKLYNSSDMRNYDITKYSAIDGSTLDVNSIPLTDMAKLEMKQLETLGFRYKHYQLTTGAIGCYLSHVKIWEQILKSSQDNVLIFEDDASPPPNCLSLMQMGIQHIPDDWDIILIGKHCIDCEDMGRYYKVNRFILLHTYMINKKCIRKIKEDGNLFPIGQQLDAYLSEISYKLNIYAFKNNVVVQSHSRTDIQAPIVKNRKMNDRMHLEKNKEYNE